MIILPDSTMLYDNSSLKDWRDRGPRFWYFRHFRNWIVQPKTGDTKIEPFQNGLAWHEMMDCYWTNPEAGYGPAWEVYTRYWRDHGFAGGFPIDDLDPDFEHSLQPYAPSTMEALLIAYCDLRYPILKDIELIRPERPFIVSIDPNNSKLFYMGRMDKVFHYQGRLIAADHKTTKSYLIHPIGKPHFRPYWRSQWLTATQPKGYLFALKQEFGLKRTEIWIDGVLFHQQAPTEHNFLLEPIECKDVALDAWNWLTLNTIQEIQRHIAVVETARENDTAPDLPYLPAFPCFGCSFSCPYQALCQSRENPESWIAGEETPDGFVEKQWAPFSVEEVTAALAELEETE